MKVPLSKPFLGEEEYKAAEEVLKSGWLIHGPKNEELEEKFAQFIGVKYAVSLNSCASALQLALEAQGIKGEVIMPSFTHMASANAIIRAGARPVFADIRRDTYTLDPPQIIDLIGKNTEAVMVVHFAGQGVYVDEIKSICRKYKLALVEDSAENVGGKWNGKMIGSFGTGCFSFFPSKNMTTAEGGMLTADDLKLARTARTISAHGVASSFLSRLKQKKFWIREAILPGLNFRMSNLQAAIGVEQLKKLETMNKLRRERAALLTSLLGGISEIETHYSHPQSFHVYQMYTIKVPRKIRDSLVIRLKKEGIGVSVHFDPPVHLQPFYKEKKFRQGTLDITEEVSKSIITLPLYPSVTEKEIKWIAATLKKILFNLIKK